MVNLHEVYLVVKLLLDTAGRRKHLSLLGVFGGEITDRYSWMPQPNKVSGLYLIVLLLEDTASRSRGLSRCILWCYYLYIQQRGCQGYNSDRLYLMIFLQSDTVRPGF